MLTSYEPQELEIAEPTYHEIRHLAESGAHYAVRAMITPAVAQRILDECNARNRPVRRRQSDFLTAQMEEGRFVYNGESIVFATDRHLNNGQHRLIACVNSGVPIEVLLVFGVPPERFTTYDQQAVRGAADVLAIDSRTNCKCLAAALRHVANYEGGILGSNTGRSGRKDNSFILDLAAKYPGIEESVNKFVKFRWTTPSLAAALHYLMRRVDPASADAFFDVVDHGSEVRERYGRSLVLHANHLREWLVRNAMGNRRVPDTVTANVFIKAWNGHRTGAATKTLIFRGDEKPVKVI